MSREWRCFHCDEIFTDEAEARDHFGADELAVPACRVAAADGGLLKALREAEREVGKCRRDNEQLDHEAGAYHRMIAEIERLFGTGVRSVHHAWLKLEAMESRAMVAEAALKKRFDPTNHHNAITCSYCNPKRLTLEQMTS